MLQAAKTFSKIANEKAFDLDHRKKLNFNIGKYNTAFHKGLEQYHDLETARQRAANIKRKALNDLDKNLIDFEQNFTTNGGRVLWAVDAQEAKEHVLKIFADKKVKKIVKSKSMTTEEIDLNGVLEKNGVEALETDLGEFIVQLADEKPYHIVTPAMHKSKEDIAQLFHEKFEWDIDLTPEEMTRKVRQKIRNKFFDADAGITGANFLIADTGSIALTENEGNGILTMAMPNIHIAIVGIEKVIPSINDLQLLWPLLSTHGTGQHLTVYNSIISGPKKEHEKDGPKETYVILLNNKRTDLLTQEHQSEALSCIRCGACLNVCPIYKNIGGHTYETTYSGPIGSVISPWLLDLKNYKHLSFASSLCGACTEVCPVKIPLHDLLLRNRKDAVDKKYTTNMEQVMVKGWEKVMLKPKLIDIFGGKTKNFFASLFFKKAWGAKRELPKMADKSFRQQWLEKQKK
ncbi:MAG: iron-sulfur cluster-binding protein [Bacteroidetes bacterium 4572_77]|nr:MAG: iron-sulfur cluster-binding protein [Bacteroidetes bacterium 4572_77]